MRRVLAVIALLTCGLFAYAQEPLNQLTIGYELQRAHYSDSGFRSPSLSLNGLTFSNNVRVYKWLGAEGDLSVGYKSVGGSSVLNYYVLGGPRVSYTFGRVTPYGHFLMGIDHVHDDFDGFSETGFGLGGGGGASVWLTKHFGVNGGFDYLHASKYGVGLNTFRVVAGPTFRFGGGRTVTAAALPPATSPTSVTVVQDPRKGQAQAMAPAQPKVTCSEVQINGQGDATCMKWNQSN